MKIGVPKELKTHEYRVGLTPDVVSLLSKNHEVFVETKAGEKIGFTDKKYSDAGAKIVYGPIDLYRMAEMIVKVKEPQGSELPLLQEGQILFCYLHLAPDPIQTRELLKRKVIGIAYETVTDNSGRLPLLVPMSQIAGRIAIQVGATALQINNGGSGVLLGGVPGVLPAKVTVLGGGVSGTEAARMAMGLGADVIILDKNISRLESLDALFGPKLKTEFSSPHAIEEVVIQSNLVIGAVLIPGKLAPRLITREMIKKMKPGSVFIDIAIDQGGCSETSRPTTHDHPTYVEEGVIHYCVTNMPGACAMTSTEALNNATMNYVIQLAEEGYEKALLNDRNLRNGLNVYRGKVTNEAVAMDLGYQYVSPEEALKG